MTTPQHNSNRFHGAHSFLINQYSSSPPTNPACSMEAFAASLYLHASTTCHYIQLHKSSAHPHNIRILFILILSSHLRLGFPSSAFLADFAMKISYAFLMTSMCVTCLAHLILRDLIQ